MLWLQRGSEGYNIESRSRPYITESEADTSSPWAFMARQRPQPEQQAAAANSTRSNVIDREPADNTTLSLYPYSSRSPQEHYSSGSPPRHHLIPDINEDHDSNSLVQSEAAAVQLSPQADRITLDLTMSIGAPG